MNLQFVHTLLNGNIKNLRIRCKVCSCSTDSCGSRKSSSSDDDGDDSPSFGIELVSFSLLFVARNDFEARIDSIKSNQN